MAFLRQCLHEMRLRTGGSLMDSPTAARQTTVQRVTNRLQCSLCSPPRSPLAVNLVGTAVNRRREGPWLFDDALLSCKTIRSRHLRLAVHLDNSALRAVFASTFYT